MARIEVDPSQLLRAAADLDAIQADLRLAVGRIAGLSGHRIGAVCIESALDHFADHWSYGMHQMVESVRFTAEALRMASDSYVEIERMIASGFDQD
ncbi:MAG: hypothetical protein ACRDV9_06765 [Acidimicrobiia bacterium]